MITTSPLPVAATAPPEEPIWLLISFNERELIFELPATGHRTIVVGSTKGADVLVNESPPVAFFAERQRAGICLIPGYTGSELRIDTKRFDTSCHVDARAVVQLGDLRMEVAVTDHPPTERNCATGKLRDDTSPDVTDHSRATSLDGNATTTEFCRATLSPAHRMCPTRAFTREELLQPEAFPTQTLELGRIDFGDWPSDDDWPEPGQPEVVHQPEAPRVVLRNEGSTAHQAGRQPQPASPPDARGDTTEFERPIVNPTNGATVPSTPLVEPSHPLGVMLQPSSVAPICPDGTAKRILLPLERLGMLTKRHPIRAIGAATLGSVALSILLFGVSQLIGAHLERPNVKALARSSLRADKGGGIVSIPPTIGSMDVPSLSQPLPDTAAAAATPVAVVVEDPEVTLAVGHLIAGRLVEAEQAYRELGDRYAEQPAYATSARILARRNSSDCRVASNAATNCPMVKP